MSQEAYVADLSVQGVQKIIEGLFNGSLTGSIGLEERTKLTRLMRKEISFADGVALKIIEKINSVSDDDLLTNGNDVAPLLSLIRPARNISFSTGVNQEILKILNYKLWKKFPDGSGVRILTEN